MGSLGDLALLVAEIFGGEDLFRTQVVEEETASLDFIARSD
jgi:hypothetical protein